MGEEGVTFPFWVLVSNFSSNNDAIGGPFNLALVPLKWKKLVNTIKASFTRVKEWLFIIPRKKLKVIFASAVFFLVLQVFKINWNEIMNYWN